VKINFRHLLLTAAVSAAAALSADEAVQRQLGDAAFYAGDYRNAVSSYTSALQMADKEKNPEGWAASALNLGVAYLHSGDIAGAQRIYEEFRRRFPLRSAGTLPGDLLAAKGQYAEAEKFFRSLASTDPAMADGANFSLATLYLKTGKTAQAEKIFAELAEKKDSPWQLSARNEKIYSLIRLGSYSEALAEIGLIPAEKRNADIELMQYLIEAYSGNITNFERDFRKFLEKLPPHPHLRVLELLDQAAKTARKNRKFSFASEALRQALAFAPDNEIKQGLHKSLIELLLDYDQKTAAVEARRYTELYPAAKDRAAVVTAAAQRMKNPNPDALELYSFITRGKFSAQEKIDAAMAAASIAEEVREFSVLEKISGFLNNRLPAERKTDYQCRYAAYLEKSGKILQAEQVLKKALAGTRALEKAELTEKVAFELLNFNLRRNNSAEIGKFAERLENASAKDIRYAAKMALGQILDKAGDSKQARRKFLDAAQILPSQEAPALFMAAVMAAKSYDHAVAAAEFAALAMKYPAFAKTPEALFMAADLYSTVNDTANADKASDLLQSKYPASEAFAASVLRIALEKGNAGNIQEAIADLVKLEKDFAPSAIADEAALLQAVFLNRSGRTAEAMAIFRKIAKSPTPAHAAESSLRMGEIFRKEGKLDEAFQMFVNCAALLPGTVTGDNALLQAGSCLLAQKAPLAPEKAFAAQQILDKLAMESKIAAVRLEALYKAGKALEHLGKKDEALSRYEKSLYTASAIIEQGMIPEARWCEKACEDALRLIAEKREPGALQRGMRLIDRCKDLMLPDKEFIEKMRNDFRKELKQRRVVKNVSGKVDK